MTEKQTFHSRISRFSAVRRRVLNATSAYRVAALATTAGIGALLFLSGWLPNAFVNLALFAALAIFLVGLIVKYARNHAWFRSPLDEAFIMEILAGGLNSRIISALDFLNHETPAPLALAVIERSSQDLAFPFERQLDRTARNQRRKQFLIRLVAFIAIGLTPWFAFGKVAENFQQSWLAARDALFPVQYTLSPGAGKHIHRLGEQVQVGLKFNRPGYKQVTLQHVRRKDQASQHSLDLDEEHQTSHVISSDVEAEHIVHFEFGERRSDEMTFIFTTPPTLVNMQTELLYPNYTQLLPRTLEGVQQRLLGLPGTRMTLGWTFSKDLEAATLTWDDGQVLPLDVVGRFASVNLLHTRQRQGTLQVKDLHGFAMDYPLVIDFDIQNDEKPQLFLPRHITEDMPLLENGVKLFGFGIRAQDDFGITRCVLRWTKSTVENPASISEQGEIERLISPTRRKAVVVFEKVFEGLALRPGDKLNFRVEAYDNRAPDKQMTRSRSCSFFIYQDELGGLTIAQLGFNKDALQQQRIAKSIRATAVKAPEGLRTREKVRNEHQAEVVTSAQSPTVRGEFSRATKDYFRLLSSVPYDKEEKGGSSAGDAEGRMEQEPPDTEAKP